MSMPAAGLVGPVVQPVQEFAILHQPTVSDPAGHHHDVGHRGLFVTGGRDQRRALGAGYRPGSRADQIQPEMVGQPTEQLERSAHVEQLEVVEQHDSHQPRPVPFVHGAQCGGWDRAGRAEYTLKAQDSTGWPFGGRLSCSHETPGRPWQCTRSRN